MIRILSAKSSLDDKLRQLPLFPPVDTPCVNAIRSVFAFALLCRFEEYLEQERERIGLRRRFINQSGLDLLRVLGQLRFQSEEEKFEAVIACEARQFLCFLPNPDELHVAIRQSADVFRIIAREAAELEGATRSAS